MKNVRRMAEDVTEEWDIDKKHQKPLEKATKIWKKTQMEWNMHEEMIKKKKKYWKMAEKIGKRNWSYLEKVPWLLQEGDLKVRLIGRPCADSDLHQHLTRVLHAGPVNHLAAALPSYHVQQGVA